MVSGSVGEEEEEEEGEGCCRGFEVAGLLLTTEQEKRDRE